MVESGDNMIQEDEELKNRKYERAIRNIKSDFYDVLAVELSEISLLESKLLQTRAPSEQTLLKEKIHNQQKLLDETIKTVSNLVENIKKFDSFNREEVKAEKIAEVITEISEPNTAIQGAIAKDLKAGEISKEEIKQTIEEVVNNHENIGNIVKDGLENAMPIIAEGPTTTKEAEKIPDIVKDDLAKKELDKQESFSSVVSELADIYAKEEKQNNNEEQLKQEKEDIKIDSTLELVDKQQQLKKIRKYQKSSKKVTKAIIVSKKQLEKLAKSRLRQEDLLLSKKLLKETDGLKNVEGVVDQQLAKEILKERNILNNNPNISPKKYDDPERELEDLTVKAKVLYDANQKDAAQELYNRISEINTTLAVKQQVKK